MASYSYWTTKNKIDVVIIFYNYFNVSESLCIIVSIINDYLIQELNIALIIINTQFVLDNIWNWCNKTASKLETLFISQLKMKLRRSDEIILILLNEYASLEDLCLIRVIDYKEHMHDVDLSIQIYSVCIQTAKFRYILLY